MPPIVEVTSPALAYLRLHGRNGATWNTGRTVAERFDYVYSDEEMEEWIDPVLDMAERAQEVAVVFNNNARDYALRRGEPVRRADFRCRGADSHRAPFGALSPAQRRLAIGSRWWEWLLPTQLVASQGRPRR